MEGGWLGKGGIWSFWCFKHDPVSSVGDMEVDILSTLEGFLGKVEEENCVVSWAPNTQKSLITKYTLETRRIPSPTHTHTHTVLSFVVAAAKWLFTFSAGCFYLPALCCSPLMKGSVYGGGSSQRRVVSAAQRNIKDALGRSPRQREGGEQGRRGAK